jgi:hypothetical protein
VKQHRVVVLAEAERLAHRLRYANMACDRQKSYDCCPTETGARDHLHYIVLGLQAPRIDPESLEQENDRSIEALGERTNLLRQVSCR